MSTSTSLLQVLASNAARTNARRVCLSADGRSWTFEQFDAEVDKLAVGLAARYRAGERIALFMANRPEYLLLQFAFERAGLVRVPLNARYTAHEASVIVEDCAARAIFCDASTQVRALDAAQASQGCDCWSVDDALLDERFMHCGELRSQVSAEALCSINYTSGSSGKPKGVMLSHRNWSALVRNMLVDRDFRADDVVAHVGPLTHASGTYFMPFFLRGARQVIVDAGTVDALLDTIERERVTVFTCVPTVLTRIVNHPEIGRRDLSSLRSIGYGAEPVSANTLSRALALFGPILTQNYGLTEAMMTVALLKPEQHWTRDGSGARVPRVGCIGRPYTFVEVVLRDPGGAPVPPGTVGELTIRSEHMMPGYWNRPEETERTLRGGWLWTGDLGSADEEGFITLVGRSKEMLISGGFNIYPAELEAVLTGYPSVSEAAVIGMPDADWGESAIAFVVPAAKAQVTDEELREHCKPLLGLRSPRRIHVVTQLPRNPNGKIDKKQLREDYLRAAEHNHA